MPFGNSKTGFLLSALTILTLAILHLISLLVVKEDYVPFEQEARKTSAKDIISNTLFNKNMRRIILLNILWQFGTGISTSVFRYISDKRAWLQLKIRRNPLGALVLSGGYSHGFSANLRINIPGRICCFELFNRRVRLLVNTFTTPANGTVFYALYYMISRNIYGGKRTAES